jgi:hypothetical protein
MAALVSTLVAIRMRAGSLRMVLRMVLRRMHCRMCRLHALLPELTRGIHAPTVRPLRRRRLRAQQQQRREKQPHRQRE